MLNSHQKVMLALHSILAALGVIGSIRYGLRGEHTTMAPQVIMLPYIDRPLLLRASVTQIVRVAVPDCAVSGIEARSGRINRITAVDLGAQVVVVPPSISSRPVRLIGTSLA